MRIHEVRALSQEDLVKELEAAHKEALSVRFRLATRQLSDTSQAKKVRKDIARMKTVLRERELMERRHE
ncbi:MAG: 50S ribosomal protein L29 [Chloroflexi bacterium]|nr:50S ribosomal protein L29 [Chloroflexota bacterium]